MRIHLIKWISIDEFVVKHARSKISFEKFKEEIKHADWNSINDVQKTFGSVDMIKNKRLVFNIGGNNFRLICSYWFGPNMD
jgi:mRNA interferase HigB